MNLQQKYDQFIDYLKQRLIVFLYNMQCIQSTKYDQLTDQQKQVVDRQMYETSQALSKVLGLTTENDQYKQWIIDLLNDGMIQFQYFVTGFYTQVRQALKKFNQLDFDKNVNDFKSFADLKDFLQSYGQ